jgi:carbon storage regulator
MLVLTRKVNEGIHIGDDIFVRVVDVGRGTVRLGIDAPSHVPVHRQEIFERIQEQNLESSRGASEDILKVAEVLRKRGIEESHRDS